MIYPKTTVFIYISILFHLFPLLYPHISDLMRHQFMQYLMQMQTPQYSEQLNKQIEREKVSCYCYVFIATALNYILDNHFKQPNEYLVLDGQVLMFNAIERLISLICIYYFVSFFRSKLRQMHTFSREATMPFSFLHTYIT